MNEIVLIERDNERSVVGNVIKGRVSRVLPGMQAAFVDIGLEKAAFLYAGQVPASAQVSVRLRLVHNRVEEEAPDQIDTIIDERRGEADAFFTSIYGACSGSEEARLVQRQALAGLLWSK